MRAVAMFKAVATSYSAAAHGLMPPARAVAYKGLIEGRAPRPPCFNDVIIDKVSGQVRYAALEFGGFLGMGTDRYPIPWGMLKYDTGLDGYVVPLRKEQLEKAPRHEQSSRPEYTEEYGRKVYDYYGVAWQ
jgi:hypothetical protein